MQTQFRHTALMMTCRTSVTAPPGLVKNPGSKHEGLLNAPQLISRRTETKIRSKTQSILFLPHRRALVLLLCLTAMQIHVLFLILHRLQPLPCTFGKASPTWVSSRPAPAWSTSRVVTGRQSLIDSAHPKPNLSGEGESYLSNQQIQVRVQHMNRRWEETKHTERQRNSCREQRTQSRENRSTQSDSPTISPPAMLSGPSATD